jgi:amino acid transporter
MPGFAFDALVVVAVTNGALVQIIMASRVLYGLSRQGWLPGIFGRVGTRTQTPVVATFAAATGVFAMAAAIPLVSLARATSFITLLIFALVNVALLRIRARPGADAYGRLPAAVPAAGFALSIGLAGFQVADLLGAVLP